MRALVHRCGTSTSGQDQDKMQFYRNILNQGTQCEEKNESKAWRRRQ